MLRNPIRPWKNIVRRESRGVCVGPVRVGGGAPISVQTMTNTPTTDVGSPHPLRLRIVRMRGRTLFVFSVPDEQSSKALKEIVDKSAVPVVADIHFHYRRAIESADAGAACIRINPGNIGSQKRIEIGSVRSKGKRLFDSHWRQCGKPGKASAGKVSGALSGSNGGIRS